MSEWKDLTINTPIEILISDKHEIQYYNGVSWDYLTEDYTAMNVLLNIKSLAIKYRYRLKPLEPIKITDGMIDIVFDILSEYILDDDCGNYSIDSFKDFLINKYKNRPVEIIQ